MALLIEIEYNWFQEIVCYKYKLKRATTYVALFNW